MQARNRFHGQCIELSLNIPYSFYIFQLISCADTFQLPRLKDLCEKHLIDRLSLENCVQLLCAGNATCATLTNWAVRFILGNYEKVRTNLNDLPSPVSQAKVTFRAKMCRYNIFLSEKCCNGTFWRET